MLEILHMLCYDVICVGDIILGFIFTHPPSQLTSSYLFSLGCLLALGRCMGVNW